MNSKPGWSGRLSQTSLRQLRPDWILLGICALALIPVIYLALTQYMEYDGFWHVFIAQQDNWRNFWFDYESNDHPPLFYLLLRAVMKIGRSVFVYRSISIAADLASIFLIYKIAQKLSVFRFTPYLVALAFGLSIQTIEISISVRAYMLAVFFVLLSFYFFVDLLPGSDATKPARSRILFASALVLAVSSHYFAFFYVAACGLILMLFALFAWPSFGWKGCAADAITFVPVAWLMRYFYRTHIVLHTVTGDYLAPYSYTGTETKPAFFIRNLQNTFNSLAPWPITNRIRFLAVVVALALTGAAIVIRLRSRHAVPVLMVAVILAELAWTGLHGEYPFGGLMRQQYILFPFAILSAGVYLDRVFSITRGSTAPVAAAAALAIICVSAYRFYLFPKIGGQIFDEQISRFRAVVPEPEAVLLDQFSLIAFFTYYHPWKWTFTERLPTVLPVDEYRLHLDKKRLTVLRATMTWNFDFSDPAVFRDIAASIRAAKINSLAVFCIHQMPDSPRPEQQEAFRRKVLALAQAANLEAPKLAVDGMSVYAEFAPARK